VTDDEKAEAIKRMHLAMRTKRPLAMYSRNEDPKETLLDLITTTAVMFATVPEDEAVRIFVNCLRWVRGDAKADPPQPPSTLN
jgi:hypothetical protein